MAAEVNFDELFGDMFGGGDSNSPFADIFSAEEPKAEKKKEGPQQEAPAVEEAKTEEPEAESEEEQMEPIPELTEEQTAAEENLAEVESEEAAEEKQETEAAETEPEAPAEEAKAEEAAAEEEPAPEVKVEKKTRRRRKKAEAVAEAEPAKAEEPVKAAAPAPGTSVMGTGADIDESFIKNLLVPLGPVYIEQKKKVNEMMNEIVLTADMKPAVVQVMLAKNAELARYVEIVGDGYFEAYDNLTDKETGLMARVKAQASIDSPGTKEDKANAAAIALTHYKDPKSGKELDLMTYANALRAAKNFFNGAKNYSKAVGITLNNYNRLAS